MKKLKLFLSVCVGITALYVLTAGWLLDASQKPKKADIIAVLGGDWEGYRVKTDLKLFNEGYATKNKILLNIWQDSHIVDADGKIYRSERAFLLSKGVKQSQIGKIEAAGHTMNEIKFIKAYMLAHGYRSIIIVTDPPHTRRVKMLASLARYEDAGITVLTVGAEVPWWNRSFYLGNSTARHYVMLETLKIPFNFIMYGVLEPLHLLETLRPHLHEPVHRLKEKTIKTLDAI